MNKYASFINQESMWYIFVILIKIPVFTKLVICHDISCMVFLVKY